MKRCMFLLFFIVLFSACSFSRQAYQPDQRYLANLSTMNFELWGDMSLGEYADDFSVLTYEEYIDHATEETQFREVLSKINSANERCFSASKDSFIMCLQYDAQGYAVCDNASTPRLDKIEKISAKLDLEEMMHSMLK